MIIEESKWDELNDNYECLLDFVKSFKQKAYDAWKPVQMFRSDNQVKIDEIKREVLEELEQEALSVLEMIGETFD